MPEIIDPVFAKTSPKRSVSMTEYERFGLVFTKTWVYKFGHCCLFHNRIYEPEQCRKSPNVDWEKSANLRTQRNLQRLCWGGVGGGQSHTSGWLVGDDGWFAAHVAE